MEVTSTSLYSQSTPKQVAYTSAKKQNVQGKGGYGEDLKKTLKIDRVRSEAPVIKAMAVEGAVSDPNQYTKDAIKTALEKARLALQAGFGKDTTDPTDATISPTTSGGGGGNKGFFSADDLGNLSYKNMPFVPQSQYKGVETDNLRYGDTMPDGAFGIGSKSTDDFSNLPQYQSSITKEEPRQTVAALPSDYKETEAKAFLDAKAYQAIKDAGTDKTFGGQDAQVNVGSGSLGTFGLGTYGQGAPSGDNLPAGSFNITKDEDRMGGQGGLALGTTTERQGGTVKDGIKVAPTVKTAVNASGYQQKNERGSAFSTGKVESAKPKQTVASLPSNYKATEQKAVAAAKAYKSMTDTNTIKAKQKSAGTNKTVGGKSSQANVGTGKDGGFGTGTYGKGRPSDSKTTTKAAPKKATPAQKTAVKKATTVKKSSTSKSKSGSKKSSRGSKSGGSKSGGSKSGGSKKGGSKSGGSKSNSGSKKSSRGAKGSSSKKGGTSKGGAKTNRRRSRRRCDIRCKFDISVLTNLNLIRDDLAHVAYFVKELQEE